VTIPEAANFVRYDPDKHHRSSIRLKGYDYTQHGAYFVTIVAQDRSCLFGQVTDGEIHLNDAGQMVQTVWSELPLFYPGVQNDAFVVMPNHVHGIVVLVGPATRGYARPGSDDVPPPVGAAPRGRPGPGPGDTTQSGMEDPSGMPAGNSIEPALDNSMNRGPGGRGQARGPAPTAVNVARMSLGDVVHRFKTMTTKRYADGVKHSGWPPFRGRLWQRNYYEHIIRSEADLNRIRRYVEENPLAWGTDEENPYR